VAPNWARKLPWIDGVGALAAGVLVLALRDMLAELYGISHEALTFVGLANVAYSSLGLSLGARQRRPPWHLGLLVAANLTWTVVCSVLLAHLGSDATPFGIVHLTAEGLYVLALAALEWRYRAALLGRPACV
jgi:hypothetical protein